MFRVAAILFLIISMLVVGSCTDPTTDVVYKVDGSKQCEAKSGVTLEMMERELTEKGIGVVDAYCANDGLMHATVCGAETGLINVYEIAHKDLKKALALGFKETDELSPSPQPVPCKELPDDEKTDDAH